MKILKAQTFMRIGVRACVADDVADFINRFNIAREDIQQITVDGEGNMTIFYWKEKGYLYD